MSDINVQFWFRLRSGKRFWFLCHQAKGKIVPEFKGVVQNSRCFSQALLPGPPPLDSMLQLKNTRAKKENKTSSVIPIFPCYTSDAHYICPPPMHHTLLKRHHQSESEKTPPTASSRHFQLDMVLSRVKKALVAACHLREHPSDFDHPSIQCSVLRHLCLWARLFHQQSCP